ncbi:hypothetical protein D9V32_08040 [Mycetocola tolaasinivorans]|uniref:Uncharacterized protein n=1 Tax=Mycetocola tolaasinivorans TaxID=76635 RepID=A0A3L7A6X8_9MICO|nr:hypothetical protein [Mycetocola tolaasinivorans]RLP76096.1 hypothetical protein D9V32_08040 [Mycetocola tolaasinivorans]
MSEYSTHQDEARATGAQVATFVLGMIALGIAALFSSFMGRFLAYAGTVPGREYTKNPPLDGEFVMGIAVYGPFLVVIGVLCWGIFRLGQGKSAGWITLIGLALLPVLFYGAGAIISL